MKRILVPTDFSETSEKAFRFAFGLARRTNGTVVLYHAYNPEERAWAGTDTTRRQYNIQSELNILKRMQRLSKKVTEDSAVVTVSKIVGRSPLIDNILGFAEDNYIDLIVMGTQGRSGLKKKIIGSVAERIVKQSSVPVLLVPEKYEGEEPKHFVFASDYHPAEKEALVLADAMANWYNGDISVLHVLSVYNGHSENQRKRNEFDAYSFFMQRQFPSSRMKFHSLETTALVEGLEALNEQVPYDVMVMVRRKKDSLERLFKKSFTQQMAYMTKKPLLIVPEEQ